MIACVFSGQGAQKAGMGSDLCSRSTAARDIYRLAADVLDCDLLSLDDGELAQTRYAQLSIVTMSLAAWAAFQAEDDDLPAQAFAGFSLGEYTVLGAAGVLELPDLLKLVRERARLMQAASDAVPGAMYAVMGLDEASLLEVVGRPGFENKVFAVNFNSPGQTVIAGLAAETELCTHELGAAGARKIRKLNVSGAFHTPLMRPAALELADFARGLKFGQPLGRLYANGSAGPIPADVSWPDYLAAHMCGPVHWTDEVMNLHQNGCQAFLEFGPGKVLTGLIRKIVPDCPALPIEDSITLAAALSAAKELGR